MRALFRDRREAGLKLARNLFAYTRSPEVAVLGVPRGGVPIAFEIARALDLALDVFVVRKLTAVAAGSDQRAVIGAVASGGVTVLDEEQIERLALDRQAVDRQIVAELLELDHREAMYRGRHTAVPLRSRTVVLVDDGLSSAPVLRAAVNGVRMFEPSWIVLAAPVELLSTCESMSGWADEVVWAVPPRRTNAEIWYDDASEPHDEEVRALLASSMTSGRDISRQSL
jgi:putative phosphoribosyl transferase